jgi:circadian clock protein KaiC
MEFLVHGAVDYNEPGVFMAFEETGEELTKNVKSLGFDLKKLSDDREKALVEQREEMAARRGADSN